MITNQPILAYYVDLSKQLQADILDYDNKLTMAICFKSQSNEYGMAYSRF
jgi:hypothetical protein